MSATVSPQHIVRHVLQGQTPAPVAVTAVSASRAVAYQAMAAAAWRATETLDPTFPPHAWNQSGFSDRYDAAKFGGDYADYAQHAYACAVCYSIRIPEDALSGAACDLESVSVTARGDRWLKSGAILAAIPSASPSPPEWADVLAATTESAAVLAVASPGNQASDTEADIQLELPASTAAPKWLHLVLRLADYLDGRTLSDGRDNAWIEGSAMLLPDTLSIEFSRAVAEDGGTPPCASEDATIPNESARFLLASSMDAGPTCATPATLAHWLAAAYDAARGVASAHPDGDGPGIGGTILEWGPTANRIFLAGRALSRCYFWPSATLLRRIVFSSAFAPSNGIAYRVVAYLCSQPVDAGQRLDPSPARLSYSAALLSGSAASVATVADAEADPPVEAKTLTVLWKASATASPDATLEGFEVGRKFTSPALTLLLFAVPVRVDSLPGDSAGEYLDSFDPGSITLEA